MIQATNGERHTPDLIDNVAVVRERYERGVGSGR